MSLCVGRARVAPGCDPERDADCLRSPITLKSVGYIAAPELYILYFDHVLDVPVLDLFQHSDGLKFAGIVDGNGRAVDPCQRE